MKELKGFATAPGSGVMANDASLKASGDSTDGALSVFEIVVEGGPDFGELHSADEKERTAVQARYGIHAVDESK